MASMIQYQRKQDRAARHEAIQHRVVASAVIGLRWLGAGLAVALLAAASHTDGPADLRLDPMTALDSKAACTAALKDDCVSRGRH